VWEVIEPGIPWRPWGPTGPWGPKVTTSTTELIGWVKLIVLDPWSVIWTAVPLDEFISIVDINMILQLFL
jgi:hypothetical protein